MLLRHKYLTFDYPGNNEKVMTILTSMPIEHISKYPRLNHKCFVCGGISKSNTNRSIIIFAWDDYNDATPPLTDNFKFISLCESCEKLSDPWANYIYKEQEELDKFNRKFENIKKIYSLDNNDKWYEYKYVDTPIDEIINNKYNIISPLISIEEISETTEPIIKKQEQFILYRFTHSTVRNKWKDIKNFEYILQKPFSQFNRFEAGFVISNIENMNPSNFYTSRYFSHERYLETEHWKKLKEKALDYYKNTCIICKANNCKFELHHINYDYYHEIMDKDIILLCKDCHKLIHNKLILSHDTYDYYMRKNINTVVRVSSCYVNEYVNKNIIHIDKLSEIYNIY